MSAVEVARQILRNRATLPANPVEWGRAFALTPAEATRLVRAEEAARR